MKSKMQLLIVLTVVLVVPQLLRAQATSRVIPFSNVATTIAPGSTGQALTLQVWDAASGGNLVFNEAQTLDVDANGNISFVLGALTGGGLDPNNFPSGSSRFLDVVDGTGASVLPNGRIPLNATPFALSPGPQGPAGPAGPQGDPGPPGPVNSVTAGDTSISIGGSVANPTVAVAANGVTNANVANGALSPLKIAGTAATLGPNTFVGAQSITGPTGTLMVSGNLFSGAIQTGFANIRGRTIIQGNGLDITIGDVGCGPPTGGIGAGVVTCNTFALGMDSSTNSTFINRPTGGAIHFKEGNAGPDQMTIASGGNVGIGATPVSAARLTVSTSSTNVDGVAVFSSSRGVFASGGETGVAADSTSGLALLAGTLTGPNIAVFSAGGFNRARIDSTGKVFANGGFQSSGADFAESFEVVGERADYEPGDVVVIDETGHRRMALARQPYSTLVAGIYSTKPGMLATPYGMDDPRLAKEIPLAVMGTVPCKVSAENGPIEVGDLLVTSSTPGYAMKGTDRSRMLGAVVGKALEPFDPRDGQGQPLASGKGVIQVLVTLQ